MLQISVSILNALKDKIHPDQNFNTFYFQKEPSLHEQILKGVFYVIVPLSEQRHEIKHLIEAQFIYLPPIPQITSRIPDFVILAVSLQQQFTEEKKMEFGMMWHGRIKLIIGVWLIISGFITPLQNPVNLMIIGFIAGMCCFRSYRFWQTGATGIVGMWLFYSGLVDLMYAGNNLTVLANFLIPGLLLSVLGMLCIYIHSREKLTDEDSLGIRQF